MRLLWMCVFVGVAGGVAEETEEYYQRKWEVCQKEEDTELCYKEVLFTATALEEVRDGEKLEVLVSLEKSLHPHVTFDLILRTLKEKDAKGFRHEDQSGEEDVLAREEVTLEVNDLRRVVLRVSDLPWNKASLVVKARPLGQAELAWQTYAEIKKVTSDDQVFVQTDKSEYAPGDTVNWRALVVDGNVDKTPKFAQIFIEFDNIGVGKWVEVPESGIVRGNFTFDSLTIIRARVTSNVTSSDASTATSPALRVSEHSKKPGSHHSPLQFMSVSFEGLNDVSFSQPRLKGRVKLTSTDGFPLRGACNVNIKRDWWVEVLFPNQTTTRRAVGVNEAGGEFDFDVVEELGAEWEGAREKNELNVEAKCVHFQSGSVVEATETIRLWRSVFRVDLLSVRILPKGNSSHQQTTVVLKFLVERRDGGSVEEEEPSKGLQVKLLPSKENLMRLRPSASEFSLPIPPNGLVRLEFQVNDTPPSPWTDIIAMEVGDEKKEERLEKSPIDLLPFIHVTPVDPARLVRRGDVVRFRLRSCLPYANVNAILSSHKAIYSTRRFSFSQQGEALDEVIELTIPQNATEGSMILTVYGRSKNPNILLDTDRSSVKLNVVSSHGGQYIKIVDQVDVEMSTIVTFRLEGMDADSVVSLQAAKLESHDEYPEGREDTEGPLRCHDEGYLRTRETPDIKYRDDSPDAVEPNDVDVSANFILRKEGTLNRHPPLVFIDAERKTSTEDNGTLTVTKTFDRLTEFGTYVVSGATFHSKSGRTVFSNSPVLKILPPPVTLKVSVAPSVLLGETVDVIGYVQNNLATPFEGHVTLHSTEEGSTEVTEMFVRVKPNAFKILKMEVTPQIGDLFVSISSNISSRLTVTKKVSVFPFNSNS